MKNRQNNNVQRPLRPSFLKFGNIGTGVLLFLFGMAFLIAPELSGNIIVYALASVLVLIGASSVFSYFYDERYSVMIRNSLTMGVACAAIGIFLLCKPDLVIDFLPILWGCILVFGGISKAQSAIDLHRMCYKRWFIELACAILSLILGIIILCDPFSIAMTLMRFIGISLALEGASDIVTCFTLHRVTHLYYPDKQ